MFPPLEEPLARHVQSLSQDLSSWSIHKSCAPVFCKKCKYCRLASWPPLAHSSVETVALTSRLKSMSVVTEGRYWRLGPKSHYQSHPGSMVHTSQQSGVQIRSHAKCLKRNQPQSLSLKEQGEIGTVVVLFAGPSTLWQSHPICTDDDCWSSPLFLWRCCNCVSVICYPFLS